MSSIHPREQKTVLDCFSDEEYLSAAQILTMLRNNKETEIGTDLHYHVRYILSYLEMKGDLKFDMWTATYRRA